MVTIKQPVYHELFNLLILYRTGKLLDWSDRGGRGDLWLISKCHTGCQRTRHGLAKRHNRRWDCCQDNSRETNHG